VKIVAGSQSRSILESPNQKTQGFVVLIGLEERGFGLILGT
jgi:hypothetical protein